MNNKEPLQSTESSWEVPFGGRSFLVNKNTLKPTPETVTLVELASLEIEKMIEKIPFPKIVDVGTGCGNIGISIALSCPNVKVFCTDISPEAVMIAEKNILNYGLSDRMEVLVGDLLSPILGLSLSGSIDLIVSNPPYIPTSSIQGLTPEIRNNQPFIALNGGTFGMDIISKLIDESAYLLRPEGTLIFEFGKDQDKIVRRLLSRHGGYNKMDMYDHDGSMRFVKAMKQ